MKFQESEEMYLETILVLKRAKETVRSIDVAEHLNYSKPSVSRAIGLLKNKDYIAVDESGAITFTIKGESKAKGIYERHSILTAFLMKIGASKEAAEENACRIEHIISAELFEIIKQYIRKKPV